MVPHFVLFLFAISLIQEVNSECETDYQIRRARDENGFHTRRSVLVFWVCRNISSLEEVTKSSSQKEELYGIKLTSSVIPTIPPSSFESFRNISKLELSNIGLRNISAGAFDKLENLEVLNISSNLLERIDDGVFSSLQHLNVLDLSNNQIGEISKTAFASNLTSLNLSGNRLRNIDNDLWTNLPSLRKLDVSRNPLEEISLKSYENFDLRLTLPSQEQFHSEVKSFYSLNWSHSQLSKINISSLPAVQNLDLSYNKLKNIENLATLRAAAIRLHNNELTVIDERFFGYQKPHLLFTLSFLDLSFNEICEIKRDAFQYLGWLGHLSLNNNNITEIEPALFKNMERLTFLNLSSNNIKEFQFGTFDFLFTLETLDVSRNNLIHLDENIYHNLKRLEKLYFHDNQISHLDTEEWKYHHQKLNMISLYGNNFTCQNILKIVRSLKDVHVQAPENRKFDGHNYYGTSCVSDEHFGHNSVSKLLERIMKDDNVSRSEMVHFLKHHFEKSKFVEHSNKDHNQRRLSLAKHSDYISILNLVFEIIFSVLILCALVYIFMYLKKFVSPKNMAASSEMNLL